VIHPIPPGTRDLLPEEMRELRELHAMLLGVFERFGYGEVRTPTLEYDEVVARGDGRTAAAGYRLFAEEGELLALRSDMTVPIARLAASRFAGDEGPLRFSYLAPAYRAVRPRSGQLREFEQAGVELIGVPAPDGTAEVIEVLDAALKAAGLGRAVIGLGDGDVYPALLDEFEIEGERRATVLERLERHDLVGLGEVLGGLESLGADERRTLLEFPQLRGGVEVLERARQLGGEAVARAVARIQATFEAVDARGAAGRVRVDLGLIRDFDYYTGAVLEVYDPALGHILGGGGRYDRLLGRFGADRPAAGFSLYVERVQLARAATDEGPGDRGATEGSR